MPLLWPCPMDKSPCYEDDPRSRSAPLLRWADHTGKSHRPADRPIYLERRAPPESLKATSALVVARASRGYWLDLG